MSQIMGTANEGSEVLLTEATDAFMEELSRGQQPDVEEYSRRYPAVADALRHVLPALRLLHVPDNAPETGSEHALGCLGDFRIRHEVGRGGMAVVYEAEQISLGRRVALKVLPFAATLDSKQLQRFKNEAQAAAHLHHQSIVPVYATGCERGVHYYAMQFIDGQTLAAVIAELRGHENKEAVGDRKSPAALSEPANAMLTAPWIPKDRPIPTGTQSSTTAPCTGLTPPVPTKTTPQAGVSTERSIRSPAYFRTVAQLAVQAAQALEHAHQMGVIHRDIKPANLLVDGRGHLWVTDFGLAHCQSHAELTMSGDLVGPLRYMSPEQALAHRVAIDHRTDIYSLGATLYELLTLRPAFNGHDRQELLRQIAFEEPRPPSAYNKGIPPELEIIFLKAMQKNPGERYATAQEVADDLERFLKDEPIRAKRPTLLQRGRRWARRHKSVVWSALACLVLSSVVLAGAAGWIVRDRIARTIVGGSAGDSGFGRLPGTVKRLSLLSRK